MGFYYGKIATIFTGFLGFLNHQQYCWWKKSCTSWYGSFSHYLRAFIHPRWLALGFLNHQQYGLGMEFSTKWEFSSACWTTLIDPPSLTCGVTRIDKSYTVIHISIAIYDHSSRFIVSKSSGGGGRVKGKYQSCFVLVNFVKATSTLWLWNIWWEPRRDISKVNPKNQQNILSFAMGLGHLKSCYSSCLLSIGKGKRRVKQKKLASWWFQPNWNILVKLDHFPR